MWLAPVETEGHGLVENAPLSREEQGDEFLLMGLRLSEGVDPRVFEKVSGRLIEPERFAAWSKTVSSSSMSAGAFGDRNGRAAARYRSRRRSGVSSALGLGDATRLCRACLGVSPVRKHEMRNPPHSTALESPIRAVWPAE